MDRFATNALILLILLSTLVEPAFANKFTTISGGVNGMSDEKILFLKQISLYAGGFFLFLASMALLTRRRFEGFAGYTSKRDVSSVVKGAAILTVIGSVLLVLGLI